MFVTLFYVLLQVLYEHLSAERLVYSFFLEAFTLLRRKIFRRENPEEENFL